MIRRDSCWSYLLPSNIMKYKFEVLSPLLGCYEHVQLDGLLKNRVETLEICAD